MNEAIITGVCTILGSAITGLITYFATRQNVKKAKLSEAADCLNLYLHAVAEYGKLVDEMTKSYEATGKIEVKALVTRKKEINDALEVELGTRLTTPSQTKVLIAEMQKMSGKK